MLESTHLQPADHIWLQTHRCLQCVYEKPDARMLRKPKLILGWQRSLAQQVWEPLCFRMLYIHIHILARSLKPASVLPLGRLRITAFQAACCSSAVRLILGEEFLFIPNCLFKS